MGSSRPCWGKLQVGCGMTRVTLKVAENQKASQTQIICVELVFLSIESFYERSKAFDINMMKRVDIKLLVLLLYRQLYLAQPFLFIFNHA